MLYGGKERDRYEDMPHTYHVNWCGTLGEGTYGCVYVGTTASRTGAQRAFAIKMLRDNDKAGVGVPKGFDADAVFSAENEVSRHVALGFLPNVVALLGVALFRRPPNKNPVTKSWTSHIGLVFDLYETDVRQFLQFNSFTQGGMRHVLSSVLEGLRFIHDRGCIHCDLKPANIFMRGAFRLRGCFAFHFARDRDAITPCSHSRTEFQYQIPGSFEVPKGVHLDHT